MSSIRFDHVWKYFGSEDKPAVVDLNLEIRDREFLVLVGPSGCGKTTCLRMLAGLEMPSYGRIWIGQNDVTDLAPGQRDVSMVFQNYALYPNMNVYENLAFGPEVRHETRGDIQRKVQEVADTLEIGGLLRRRPGELSGGQRQRVALGRAMIRQPKLFLMDEPLSNLDAALRVQMRSELIRLHQEQEVTTVYVTHDQVEALTMGDRVAVIQNGVLLQVDTPGNLYDNPADLFVGTFIGSPRMNVLPAEIVGSGSGSGVSVLGQTILLPERAHLSALSRDVLVGVRPTDVQLADRADPRIVAIRGTVDVREHTGPELFAWVHVGGERIAARLPKSSTVRAGDQVDLGFSMDDVYIFDADTHQAVLDRSSGSAIA